MLTGGIVSRSAERGKLCVQRPRGLQAELERGDPVALVGCVDAVLGQREAAHDRRDAALGERGEDRDRAAERTTTGATPVACSSARRAAWSAGAAGRSATARRRAGAARARRRRAARRAAAARAPRAISSLRWPPASRTDRLASARSGTIVRGSPACTWWTSTEVPAIVRRCSSSPARVGGGRRPRPAGGRPAAAAPTRRASACDGASRPARSGSGGRPVSGSGRTAASRRCRTWTALSAAPPNSPECAGRSPVVTTRSAQTIPRADGQRRRVGVHLPASKTIAASAPRSSAAIQRSAVSAGGLLLALDAARAH